MEPPYQRRGGLWSDRDKALLIDSIINGYDIPKLYVADFTAMPTPLNVRELPYAVIDGKQRFEAIFDFFNDRLALNDDFALVDAPEIDLAGVSFNFLITTFPHYAARVTDYDLAVMRVITDDESRIRQLFVRLNRSKPLTGAEARNAMEGIVPELIRRLADHQFFKRKIRFSVNRGGDRNTAAKLLLVEFRGQLVDTKKGRLDRFVREAAKISDEIVTDAVESEAPLADFYRAAERVTEVLDRMLRVFRDHDPLLRTQGPVTVYYWLIREVEPQWLDDVRDFLSAFEAERRHHRAISQVVGVTALDEELVRYDLLNRSTNDQVSLEGRFAILLRRFLRWLEERNV